MERKTIVRSPVLTCTHDRPWRGAKNGNRGEEKRTRRARRCGGQGGGARWPPIEQGGTGKSYGPPRRPSLLLIPTGVSFVPFPPLFLLPLSLLFSKRAPRHRPPSRASPVRTRVHRVYKTLSSPFRDRPDSTIMPRDRPASDRASCFATRLDYPENRRKITHLYVYRITMLHRLATTTFLPLSPRSSFFSFPPQPSFSSPPSLSFSSFLPRMSIAFHAAYDASSTWFFRFGQRGRRLTDRNRSKKIDYDESGGEKREKETENSLSIYPLSLSLSKLRNYVIEALRTRLSLSKLLLSHRMLSAILRSMECARTRASTLCPRATINPRDYNHFASSKWWNIGLVRYKASRLFRRIRLCYTEKGRESIRAESRLSRVFELT